MQKAQETWVWSLSRKDPLEEGRVTQSSAPAWEILWTEEPGGLQSIGLQSQTRLNPLSMSKVVSSKGWQNCSN